MNDQPGSTATRQRAELGTLRVAWLVSALSFRRLLNRTSALRRRKPARPGRTATPRKPAAGKFLLGFFAVLFVFQTLTVTARLVHRAARAVEQAQAPQVIFVQQKTLEVLKYVAKYTGCEGARPLGEFTDAFDGALRLETLELRDPADRAQRQRELESWFFAHCSQGFRASSLPMLVFWPDAALWLHADPLAMPKALSLVALLLSLAVMLQNVAGSGRDLTDVDERSEWLFSFPVRARSLFLARVLATALVGPSLWVLVFPLYAGIFWCAGYGPMGILLGAGAAFYVGILAGSLRVLAETVLRRLLSAANVSRVQALLTLVAYAAMLAAFALAYSPNLGWVFGPSLRLPDLALYNPGSAPLLLAARGGSAVLGALVSLGFLVAVAASSVWIAERMVRDGVVAGAGAFQGVRGKAAPAPSGTLLRGVALKELRALFRDRQLRTQAFVSPVLIAGLQIWLNPSLLSSLGSSPRHIATAAFGTAMFPLLTGACSGIATEGAALWMLYTAPAPLERLLLAKTHVWVGVAGGFALLVLVGLWARAPALLLPTLPYMPLVLVGVYLYSLIALGVGALGTDPLENEPRRRVRPGAVYLFMLLASLFGYAVYTPSLWAKLVQVALSALLAYALWQKLKDHLPYLLDPTEAPPPSIAVADGVLAALGFFVFQGVFVLIFGSRGGSMARDLTIAFSVAGTLVTMAALWVFRRSKVPNLLATLGLVRPARGSVAGALAAGMLAGLGAAALALGYRLLVARVPSLERVSDETLKFSAEELRGSGRLWLTVLTVGAAPIFEEFIFRGVLYRGFRRSLRAPAAALASALVFALVHPAVSALPVFVMAYLAARVYERFRWLAAPVATHMTYNALLVGVGLWLR